MHKKLSTKTGVRIKNKQRCGKVINNRRIIPQKPRDIRRNCAKYTKKLSTIQENAFKQYFVFYRFAAVTSVFTKAIKGLGYGDTPRSAIIRPSAPFTR